MNATVPSRATRAAFASTTMALLLLLAGCASDGVSTSSHVSVGYGYGGYYGPYYGGGYYAPYPPVVVVPPGDRPDRPDGGNRPTTLPAEVGPSTRPAMAPPRPSTASRPTTRPAPRPAPRPMPRTGRMR